MKTVEEILAAMQSIVDAAAGRSLTDDEVSKYEALEKDLAAAQKSDEIRKRNAAYNTVVVPAGVPRTGVKPDTIDAAFDSFLRSGRPNADIANLSVQVTNAQGESTPSTGGYLVPDGFREKMVEKIVSFGGLASAVDTFTTGNGANVSWTTIDDDSSNVGEIVNEGGTFTTGADLSFGKNQLGAYRYATAGTGNAALRVSVELLQDSAFDIQGLVTRKLGERIGRIQAQHWVRGTGIGEPLGITTGVTGVEPADDTTTPTYADLLTWIHSIDPAYRPNAKWAFNDSSLKTLRGIVDTNGRPLVKAADDSIAGGPGGETLLGYPIVIDQAFPDFDVDENSTNWGVFGDLREAYVIRRVRDVVIAVNPYERMSNGEVTYSAWARADGTIQNANAYICMTGEEA